MKNMLDSILIYDGACNLCNKLFLFIERKNRDTKIFMAPYQSETGKEIIRYFWVEKDVPDSLVYIKNEIIYLKSDAVLQILRDMGGFWKMLSYSFIIFPNSMLDRIYDIIAQNRYRMFGSSPSCLYHGA